jgi:hypothetical protein
MRGICEDTNHTELRSISQGSRVQRSLYHKEVIQFSTIPVSHSSSGTYSHLDYRILLVDLVREHLKLLLTRSTWTRSVNTVAVDCLVFFVYCFISLAMPWWVLADIYEGVINISEQDSQEIQMITMVERLLVPKSRTDSDTSPWIRTPISSNIHFLSSITVPCKTCRSS